MADGTSFACRLKLTTFAVANDDEGAEAVGLPLTTFVTRLIETTVSSMSSWLVSIRSHFSPL
jgi:hypothetical protein